MTRGSMNGNTSKGVPMKRIIILIGAAGLTAAALITNVAAAGVRWHAGVRW